MDLIVTAPLNVAQAVLGAKLSVETLDGRTVTLSIPGGTSSGKRFRVRGQGVAAGGATGDLLVEVRVVVPERVTEAQAELLRRFAEATRLEH